LRCLVGVSGRISVAGLVCVKPGQRPRLLYRVKVHRARKGERRSFAETDYAALLDAAHQYLEAPIVVIWDNLNTHVSAAMRELAASRDWLHVIQLPAYAPDLNPTEGVLGSVGSLRKRGIGCSRFEALAPQAHAVQGPEGVGVHEGARHPFLVRGQSGDLKGAGRVAQCGRTKPNFVASAKPRLP
jgi:hypothetical protein